MVNAQQWLDKNYPKERRNEVREVHLNEPNLEGELDLGDFVHREGSKVKVYISSNIDRTKLTIKNKPEKTRIILQNPLNPIWTAWKEIGLTYQEAQQWILIGFGSKDYNEVKQWINNNFTFQEVKDWMNIGLNKLNKQEVEFASYLRWKGYQPIQDLNLEELKKEFNTWEKEVKLAQEYLDVVYPKEQRGIIKNLNVTFKNLTGSLDLRDFMNLEILDCCRNQLTSLNLGNCLKLKRINCSHNKLTELNVDNLSNLGELQCSSNQLVNLDASNCNQLEKLVCDNNHLENLKLPSRIEQLVYLNINSNNFPKQDLSKFSHLVNLRELHLGNWNEEKNKQGTYSRFYGSLELLKNLSKLEGLDISNTDINSGVEYLPNNFKSYWLSKKQWKVFYSIAERPESKVKEIAEQLTNFLEFGLCKKCQKVISKYNWCYHCNENANPTVDDFIQKYENLKLIPYEQFEIEKDENGNDKILGEGGFGEVYKAKWINENKTVALKSLNNSQNISEEFLREIANHQALFNCGTIVKCHGISKDPQTDNYLMVMDYIKGGDLRNFLKNNQLSFEEKLGSLLNITWGLSEIHKRKLTHHDFHSGNILNKKVDTWKNRNPCCITDLGLCRPANEVDKGKVYGILPYVAPEVLKGQPYTQASDIFSLGIVAYELFAKKPPYHEFSHDKFLAISICLGLRPNINKVSIPQLLKDLIEKCWDANPENRPKANKLIKIERSWLSGTRNDKNSEFAQQYQEIVKMEKQKLCQMLSKLYKEYKGETKEVKPEEIEEVKKELFEEFFKKDEYRKINKGKKTVKANKELSKLLVKENDLVYRTHPRAIYTSRHLDFKNLPKSRNSKEINERFWNFQQNNFSKSIGFNSEEVNKFFEKDKKETQNQNETPPQTKFAKLTGLLKVIDIEEKKELQTESVEIDNNQFSQLIEFTTTELNQVNWEEIAEEQPNWTNVHPNFTPELIQSWQSHSFTLSQTHDWLSIGLQPTDHNFAAFLRDQKQLTPEEVLNHGNLETLSQEFSTWQQQTQVEILPKK